MSQAYSENSDLNRIHKTEDKFKLEKDSDLLDDIDTIFNELETDDIPSHIKEARLNELKMRARELQAAHENASDIYKDISEEDFLKITTNNKKCIVHFYHYDFRRCDIMHTHLQKLAQKYTGVRFVKLNVEKAKFFVNKLNIQMLPAVLCFQDGVLKHRIIGFDQLGNTDNFQTRILEKKLWKLRDDEEDSDDDEDDDTGAKRSIFSKKNQDDDDDDSDY